MAFKVKHITQEEARSICDKYGFQNPPFCYYISNKELNASLYIISFGLDWDFPGTFAFIWGDMVCEMDAYPMDKYQIVNGSEDKVFKISNLSVPENFNKDITELIDLIERALSSFVIRGNNGTRWNIKAMINKENLKEEVKYFDDIRMEYIHQQKEKCYKF